MPTLRNMLLLTAVTCATASGIAYAVITKPTWMESLRSPFGQRLTVAQVSALVSRSSAGNATVEKLLPQRFQGMTGAVVKANGQRFITWIPPEGKGILVGALFDEHGENLTTRAMKDNNVVPEMAAADRQPAPQPAKAGLIDAVEKADGVVDGSRGPMVHAFIDLNCGYCSGLYRQLRPLIDAGQLRVHWIPVAVLHESSMTLAAEVLQAPNAVEKLAQHETRVNPENGAGGIAGQRASAKTQRIIEANSGLLKVVNDGVAATPVLLFRGKNGQVFQHAGLLRQPADVLAAGG